MRSGSSRWPAPIAGLLALALYAATLAPGLTWAHNGADGGDLLAAALVRGVPHPPGYPSYQLLLRLALAIAGPGRDPARTGNWLSALCAALAVALLADLIHRSLGARGRLRNSQAGAVALVAALAWAASPALWSQAVITEVYALQALACVAVLWLLWRWRAAASGPQTDRRGAGWLALAGLVFGLGLGNHLSIVLLLPGMAAWLWPDRRCLKVPPRAAAAALALAAAGAGVYLYLPLAAAGHPPVDWGMPDSVQGFLWVVSGRPYGGAVFGLPAAYLPARLAAWAGEAWRQFWPWGALLAGFGLWRLDRAAHAWWRGTLWIALAFSLYALGYNSSDSYVYLIPAWGVAAIWLAWGLAAALEWADAAAPQPWVCGLILGLAFVALPLSLAWARFERMDLSRDRAAQTYVDGVLNSAQPDGVVLVASDGPTFALWYAVYGLGRRADLLPLNVNLYAYDWYRALVARGRPSLAPAPSGQIEWPALIGQLAAAGPVYRAESLPIDTGSLAEQPAGGLVRLLPRR